MTTDRAKLEITFDQRYVVGTGCFLVTSVNQIVTQPGGTPSLYNLKSCLVVQRASIPYPERLVRVASITELTTLAPLPSALNRFKSATYAALTPMVGDIIHMGTVATPPVWEHIHGYVGDHTYTVTDVTDPSNVVVTPVFPDYGSDIGFYAARSGGTWVINPATPAADGEAERDYLGSLDTEFLVNTHNDFLGADVDVALDFVLAQRSLAQSVVDALNVDAYTGIYTELYE